MSELLCAYCLVNLNASAPLMVRQTGGTMDWLRTGAAAVKAAYLAGEVVEDKSLGGRGLPIVADTMVDGTAVCVQHFDMVWQGRMMRGAR